MPLNQAKQWNSTVPTLGCKAGYLAYEFLEVSFFHQAPSGPFAQTQRSTDTVDFSCISHTHKKQQMRTIRNSIYRRQVKPQNICSKIK